MGNDSSVVEPSSFVRPYSSEMYVSFNEPRMSSERNDSALVSNSLHVHEKRPTLLKSSFSGIWSIRYSDSVTPIPRKGHFYYYNEETHKCFIGYGINSDSNMLSDFWIFDTYTNMWSQKKLTGDIVNGRTGSRATLVNDKLYIFGGFANKTYYSDLHTIDINTGIVERISTTGDEPSPRTSPLFSLYNNKIYLWGGFNGEWPSSLHVLDLSTNNWKEYPQEISGRITSPGVVINNYYLAFGGSKSGGMLFLHYDENKITIKETSGSEPPSCIGSGMVLIDHYLFFFGGKADYDYTLVYACDTTKMWWFVFHIMPDGDTVSVADGVISNLGLFMFPRAHSFAVCYVKERREILAFLGCPEKDPIPTSVVSVGEALSVLHLRDDMLAILSSNSMF